MYIAFDNNFNRVHIKDCTTRGKYFCPYCQNPLIVRKGDIRRHHFAHAKSAKCTDTWSVDRLANISDWHKEWQDRFPIDNQEIRLTLGEITHRADVMIRRTVIEFQHSQLTSIKFSQRNAFYAGLGHKVIWIFDYRELFANGKFAALLNNNTETHYSWKNPKHTFDSFTDVDSLDDVKLYFQITDGQLLRITKISKTGFEYFNAKEISVDRFLDNLKDSDNSFAKPEPEDLTQNPEYLAFKQKYHIILNKQQDRAVQTISGANLLLAVPGSGKTTVLIARIGFMVLCRHISPKTILALTYTTKAAKEMKDRALKVFGQALSDVEFKTINSLANDILKKYERTKYSKKPKFDIIDENDQTQLFRDLYRKKNPDEDYPTEEQIKQLSVEITRIKNGVDIEEMVPATPNFKQILEEYKNILSSQEQMDFDDQIDFAVKVLRYPELLQFFRNKYQYICVDEAQDTSKRQHELIHKVSVDNVFMVGDEDQSIYSFRGAFPRALMNFEKTYRNPYLLRMEMNYRSYSEIIDIANRFVARNTMRYPKAMTANRGNGGMVELLSYQNRKEEFNQVFLSFCSNVKEETAILYHDADQGINLIATLFKNQIPFNLLQNAATFFTNRFVTDTQEFIHLALDPYDTEAFMNICNKISEVRYKKKAASKISEHAKKNHKTIIESISNNSKGKQFAECINHIKQLSKNPVEAVLYIAEITNQDGNRNAVTLKILAQHIHCISELDNYLDSLKKQIEDTVNNDTKSFLTLSTIHSAKGMEFKNVVVLDVNDYFIPRCPPYDIEENENKKDLYQEDRRLFYVAMTRAKDNLYIAHTKDGPSVFVDELFGKQQNAKCPERILPSARKTTNNPSKYKPTYDVPNKDFVSTASLVFIKADISEYKINSTIRHKSLGIGIIRAITQITNNLYIIIIDFDNGKTDKFDLDKLIQNDLIELGIKK